MKNPMNNPAYNKVSQGVEYLRPPFTFPDLSSEDGNPMKYFPLAANALRHHGFFKEAEELKKFRFSSYNEHFTHIDKFLDFKSYDEVIKEDSDYIYLKVKKGTKSISQISWFKDYNWAQLSELISDNFDMSEKNIYQRSFIHYISDSNTLAHIFEKNKQLVDFFDFDIFENNLLHTQESLKNFNIVFKAIIDNHPDIAEKFLYTRNVFGVKPINHVNEYLLSSLNFNQDESVADFGKYLHLLNTANKIAKDPSTNVVGEYLNLMVNIPSYQKLTPDEQSEKLADILGYIHIEEKKNKTKGIKI